MGASRVCSWSVLGKLVRDDVGQDLAEYGIALAVIGAGAGAAAVAMATDVGKIWQVATTVMAAAV